MPKTGDERGSEQRGINIASDTGMEYVKEGGS